MSEPTHTIARTVVAGGTTEYPTKATPLYGDHEGETLEAGDATPTNVWTSGLRRWRLEWESPLPAIEARWRARYVAHSSFSFTDPHGVTFTAIIPVGGFKVDYQYERTSSTAAGTTYPMTVEVWQGVP